MPTKLSTRAIEESTYIVTAAFTDEDGSPVTPNAGLTWTLTDGSGTVINSRTAVSITPDTSVDIVLSGNDLALSANKDEERCFLIKGTYNSSTYGNNLPFADECRFTVDNLKAQA